MKRDSLHLFQGYGVELEYMLVDRDSLAVLPVADALLKTATGRQVNEVRRGRLRWSNELVLHVIELKTNGPAAVLEDLAVEFGRQVKTINRLLEPLNGRLLPGAMHPWMNPDAETRLWPHGDRAIYQAYDRVFGCRGHGWSNLQSAHLNLPFSGDEEFGRLHAAVRLILPLLPALAAASPVMDGRVTGLLDNRLEVYRLNQSRIPAITGLVIPEAAFTGEDYRRRVLDAIYRDIAPHDPGGILREEWLNSRGAIARFERSAIEIRLLDVQECPAADLAIVQLVVAVLRDLVAETPSSWQAQQGWHEVVLAELFQRVLREGPDCPLDDDRYLALFGLSPAGLTVGELWRQLAMRLLPLESPAWPALEVIFAEGPLARRLLGALGDDPDRDRLAAVYRQLGDCLERGELFRV